MHRSKRGYGGVRFRDEKKGKRKKITIRIYINIKHKPERELSNPYTFIYIDFTSYFCFAWPSVIATFTLQRNPRNAKILSFLDKQQFVKYK